MRLTTSHRTPYRQLDHGLRPSKTSFLLVGRLFRKCFRFRKTLKQIEEEKQKKEEEKRFENIRSFEAWLGKKEKQRAQELLNREKAKTSSNNTVDGR